MTTAVNETHSVRLSLDTSELQRQVAQLSSLLEQTPQAALEGVRNRILSYLDRLDSDVIFGEHVATTGADSAVEIRCALRLGSSFESLIATFRTGEFDV